MQLRKQATVDTRAEHRFLTNYSIVQKFKTTSILREFQYSKPFLDNLFFMNPIHSYIFHLPIDFALYIMYFYPKIFHGGSLRQCFEK